MQGSTCCGAFNVLVLQFCGMSMVFTRTLTFIIDFFLFLCLSTMIVTVTTVTNSNTATTEPMITNEPIMICGEAT